MSHAPAEASLIAPSTAVVAAPASGRPSPWLAARALAVRELVRFVRQRHRVFGALGQPILFWILFGAGLGPSFRLPGTPAGSISYSEYFFPGTLVLILLFTAIFATISVIEDRREGFLQGVLVAPLPRWSMVLGKVLGGATIALAQAVLFLVLGLWWLGLPAGLIGMVGAVTLLGLLGLALTSLGFVLAWRMDSTQGFHAIMNVFLMPMWLLSGAFFPAATGVLAWIVAVNPLTYGVAALRHLLYWDANPAVRAAALPANLPGPEVSWLITLVFVLLLFAVACRTASRRTKRELA